MDATGAPARHAAAPAAGAAPAAPADPPSPAGSAAPEIRLEGVAKTYPDGTVGVAELDLTLAAGELTVLVGPSGCGKTTTMKMINRVIEPTTGRILLGGEDVTRVDPDRLRRRIGYVIQNVGLFPHQTVRANVATVPRLLGWDRRRTRERVDELLATVGLDPAVHGRRYPAQLSGGQRQRAGVARALAADPGVLLMDEPFSAVDPVVRERLQDEFLRLQEAVRKTIVFVTHDIEEAVRLGDRIAVMSAGGHVEQFAPPAELLGRPASDYVADFVGADRGLKRLAVTMIDPAVLARPPVVRPEDTLAETAVVAAGAGGAVVVDAGGRPCGWLPAGRAGARTVASAMVPLAEPVPVGSTLKTGLSVLLRADADAVPVVDGGTYVGLLTAGVVHTTLRRSVTSSS
ncbi:ABC transporter ATP-binding protein [Blastococcus sp. SYSU D00695]